MNEMKGCRSAVFAAAGVLLLGGLGDMARAASVTINYAMQQQNAAAVVAPQNATKTVATPVFTNVQATTELDDTRTLAAAPEEEKALTPSQVQDGRKLPKAYIGFDSYFSDHENIYNIPLAYSFFSDIYTQLNIPFVSAKYNISGASTDNTGLGDINLTVKHVWGTEDEIEIYSLGTIGFPTGDADKGLGSGAYVLSLTEKAVKRFGDYRCTVMAGVNLPLNEPTILGSKVNYSTSLSYMAAVERNLFLPALTLGVRAAGIHAWESKIDGADASNGLTTLDIVPEIRYAASYRTALRLAVFVPVLTEYDLPGSSSRDVIVNFGIVKSF